MNSKKIAIIRFFSALLSVAMLLGLAACYNGSGDVDSTESTSQNESLESEIDTEDTEFDSNRAEISEIGGTSETEEGKTPVESESQSNSESESQGNSESKAPSFIEEGNRAKVTTRDGLTYIASGYKSIENNAFLFDTGLEIEFEDSLFEGDFNRVSFEYYATEPTKLFITYTLDGEEKTDHFYLLPKDRSFRGLIEGYLADKKGASLKKLTVDTCEETDGAFILYDLKSEIIPLYEDDLCVENDRYKIGCRLSWGGAMTYFEDKQDGDPELSNLVNIHDTGRLIQQSFYGTYSNGEYESGTSSGTTWPYNPVQGGDRHNQGSDRLIDVEVGEDYIYILSQSLDWALDKALTYTYYENTYTLKEDHVIVDNVATDFSGWVHTAGGQEIPAVYIVSYFDTFSYYNGTKPWTDDDEGIYYEAELEGWGNAGSFPLYRGNTETWSIWINSDDNFGFGTYCPNIQKHIAIRHQYNGTKDPMGNPTSYVAPSCTIVMQSYKPIVYSYILATGSPEEIRAVFKDNKDFTTNPSLSEDRYDQLIDPGRYDMMDMDFTVENNENIFSAAKHLDVGYDAAENALRIYVENGNDPYAVLNFDWNSDKAITSDDFNTIEIEYMLPESNSSPGVTLVMFLSACRVTDWNESNAVSGTMTRDGKYHTLTIKVPASKCQGEMHKIRFDPFPYAAVGDELYIKRITFKKVDYIEPQVENDFTVKGSEQIFSSTAHSELSFDEDVGALKVVAQSDNADVNITMNLGQLNLEARVYEYYAVEYMIPATASKDKYTCTLYFDTMTNKGYTEGGKAVYSYLVADGEWHTLLIRLSDKEPWSGIVNNLRFDYFQNGCVRGDAVYIKSLSLVEREGFDVDLSVKDGIDAFSALHLTKAYFDEDAGFSCFEVSGGSDVYVVLDLTRYDLSASEYTMMVIRYRVPTTNSKAQYAPAVYFTTMDSNGYSESKSIYGEHFESDGEWHTMVFDMTQKETWTGTIAKIRLDYFQSSCTDGDVIYIESISLKK